MFTGVGDSRFFCLLQRATTAPVMEGGLPTGCAVVAFFLCCHSCCNSCKQCSSRWWCTYGWPVCCSVLTLCLQLWRQSRPVPDSSGASSSHVSIHVGPTCQTGFLQCYVAQVLFAFYYHTSGPLDTLRWCVLAASMQPGSKVVRHCHMSCYAESAYRGTFQSIA